MRFLYELRFRARLARLKSIYGNRLSVRTGVAPGSSEDVLWASLQADAPASCEFRTLSLASTDYDGRRYYDRHAALYAGVGNGREKALEHSLTFDLLDFARVRRYCDVASSDSPIVSAAREDWPGVELWRQDLVFTTDHQRRVIGGFAQKMDGVADGFFDVLTLHCSFEHFEKDSDGELVAEIDRVLSDRGACLILPIYLDAVHSLFFDPGVTPLSKTPDEPGALLCPTHDYRQSHGRYYSPRSLMERVIRRVPPTLRATLIRFTGRESVGPDVYLRFGLLLAREASVSRLETAPRSRGPSPREQSACAIQARLLDKP